MFLIFAVLLAVLCAAQTTEAIRLDWLPNDANAPLPLSTVYRAKLKTLCDLYGQMGEERAKDVIKPAAKVPILMKMCVKLKLDEENIAIGESEVWRTQFWYFAQMVVLGCLAMAIYTMGFLWYVGSAIPGAMWHNMKYTVNGWFGNNNTYATRRDGWGQIYGKAAGTTGSDSVLFNSRIPGVKIPAGVNLDTAEAKAAHEFLVQQRLKRFDAMQKGAQAAPIGSGAGDGDGDGRGAGALGETVEARGALRRKAAGTGAEDEDEDEEEGEGEGALGGRGGARGALGGGAGGGGAEEEEEEEEEGEGEGDDEDEDEEWVNVSDGEGEGEGEKEEPAAKAAASAEGGGNKKDN